MFNAPKVQKGDTVEVLLRGKASYIYGDGEAFEMGATKPSVIIPSESHVLDIKVIHSYNVGDVVRPDIEPPDGSIIKRQFPDLSQNTSAWQRRGDRWYSTRGHVYDWQMLLNTSDDATFTILDLPE